MYGTEEEELVFSPSILIRPIVSIGFPARVEGSLIPEEASGTGIGKQAEGILGLSSGVDGAESWVAGLELIGVEVARWSN